MTSAQTISFRLFASVQYLKTRGGQFRQRRILDRQSNRPAEARDRFLRVVPRTAGQESGGGGKAMHVCATSLALMLMFAAVGCFGGKAVQTQVVADMPAPAEIGPYKIGSDDLLDVLVWKQEQLSGRVRVGSDGSITLPLVGRVVATGFTTDQLQADLTKRYASYVHDPQVTVRVFNPASRVFYVLGEVTKPGMYPLMSGEVLSQALATAGGPTEYANLRKVKIIRKSGDKQLEMIVNYSEVNHGNLSADVPLRRGDTVMVP